MNDSRTDYLKAIYDESNEQVDKIATNKQLAVRLKVTPASISEMLVKLSELGLIETIPYKGCKLTQKGLDECIQILRKHRLWEVFLIRHLNYTWREAHDDAHLLEHATTRRMLDRLDNFLNFPQYCPHGSTIPQKEHENCDNRDLSLLSSLEVNEEAIISKVSEDGKLLDYLWNLGLKVGEKVRIISKGEYEGPILLIQNEKEISVSYKAAIQIYVNKNFKGENNE